MDYSELLDNLKEMESEIVECKSGFGLNPFGKTMAAFSTKKGGMIFLGVTDDRTPEGICWNQGLKDNICQVARACKPSIDPDIKEIKHDPIKSIICIKIPCGDGGVYTYKNIPYERRQGINHPLTPDEIVDIQKKRRRISFGEMPSKNSDRPGLISDIDEAEVKKHLMKSSGSVREDFDLKQFLINSELSVNGSGKVKNSAILLFGRNPSMFIPQGKINISVFPSKEITKDFIKKTIEGSLWSLYLKAFIEITRNTRTYSFIKGSERIDVPEYPTEAIREAVINAIIHRDYFSDLEIFIKIFKDRIEITNPGGFPFGGYSWDEIEKRGMSMRRNRTLADYFERINLMEKDGHGIPRIKREMKEHGLKEPFIDPTENTFKIVLFGPDEDRSRILNSPYRRVLDSSSLSERQKVILVEITSKGSINRGECSELLDIPPKTATRDLRGLVEKGFLSPSGAGKGTRYFSN